MADNTYQPGDIVPLEAEFRNAAGVLTNTTATLTVRDPSGGTTTPTPVNTGTGVYHYDFPLASNASTGVWEYIFTGTGTVTATERGTFVVESLSLVGLLGSRALVSLAEAREYVLNDVTDSSQDRKLARRINAFSEMVWGYTQREWKPTTGATRRFFSRGSGYVNFSPYDLRTATAVVAFTDFPLLEQDTLVAGTTLVTGEFDLKPTGGDSQTGTYRWLTFNQDMPYSRPAGSWTPGFAVDITGDWGITAVPSDVKEAVLIAIASATHSPEGSATRTFGALSVAEEVEPTAAESRWRALPGDSRALLQRYLDDVGLLVA